MENKSKIPVKTFKRWSPGTKIPILLGKVIYQEETNGKYGRGVHNHITDRHGNVVVLTTWRTHQKDLKQDRTYLLYNTVVDNFIPPDTWYMSNPWVSKDYRWMSMPYEDGYAKEATSNHEILESTDFRINFKIE